MSRKGIMLAYPYEEKRFKPGFVQPKVEGDRLRVIMNGEGKVKHMYSSGEKDRSFSTQHIKEELEQTGWKNVELDGEMYKHGMRHSEIRSIVSRTVNLHPQSIEMEYWLFDLINEHPQDWRLKQLQEMYYAAVTREDCKMNHLRLVQTQRCLDLDHFQNLYDLYLEQGWEGIILRYPKSFYRRKKSPWLIKLKPRMSEVFTIIGFKEEKSITGEPKGTFGSFILEDEEGRTFDCGSGPTQKQRDLIWKHTDVLHKQPCKIRFQGYTKVRQVPKMQSIDKDWLIALEKVLKGGL